MLFLLLAFLGLSLAFVGLGLLLWWSLRRVMRHPVALPLCGELGLLGLFGFGVAAVLWNFALPIKGTFAWPLLALGLVAVSAATLRTDEVRASLEAIALPAIVCATALSVLVMFAPLGYDAGLYHLPAQLWARSSHVVVGLSNFHYRFGFNSLSEPISAGLWLPGNLILIGVVAALFLFFYLLSILQFLREEKGRTMPLSVAFAVLSPLSLLLFNRYFLFQVGVDDVPAATLTLTCLFAFVRARESRDDGGEILTPLTTLFLLAAFAIAIKLSSLTVALLPAIALVISLSSPMPSRRHRVVLCLGTGALLLPVIARGTVLSGCLLFPLAGSCVESLPWANPAEADFLTKVIITWARNKQIDPENVASWAWLPDWWQQHRPMLTRIAIVTIVVSAVAWGMRAALRRTVLPVEDAGRKKAYRSTSGAVALFCAASLSLWFLGGPDPRFGAAALHVLTITPALLILASRVGVAPLERKPWRAAGSCGVALVLLLSLEIATRSWPLTAKRASLLYTRLGAPTVDTVPNRHFGVRPAVGDQCWLSRSPCSPIDSEISVANRGRWLLIEPLSRR